MFKWLSQWASDSEELNNIVERGSVLVTQLTATNPKHVHPKVYRLLVETIKTTNDEFRTMNEPLLNDYESAYLQLSIIKSFIEHVGDHQNFTEENYRQAFIQMAERHKTNVRDAIRWKRFAM